MVDIRTSLVVMRILDVRTAKLILHACKQCIFGACVLPCFGTMDKQRNNLSEKTVKSILRVKANLEVSCGEMQQILSTNKELQEQILFSAK